jgi:hypothetical protein
MTLTLLTFVSRNIPLTQTEVTTVCSPRAYTLSGVPYNGSHTWNHGEGSYKAVLEGGVVQSLSPRTFLVLVHVFHVHANNRDRRWTLCRRPNQSVMNVKGISSRYEMLLG